LWGAPGTLKTRSALSIGKVAYFSFERGAQYYRKEFNVDEFVPKTFNDVIDSLRWLATNRHDYNTVVIDTISAAYEMCQNDFLTEKQRKKGGEVTIDGGDWKTIKPRFYELCNLLSKIDMNVVAIARTTKNYLADGSGDMLKIDKNDPESPQCEKNTAYLFDIEIQLNIDRRAGGKRIIATTRKDRTNIFPTKPFDWNENAVREYFGATIDRPSNPNDNIDDLPVCADCESTIAAVGELTPEATATACAAQFGRPLCKECRTKEKEKLQEEKNHQDGLISNTTNNTEENN